MNKDVSIKNTNTPAFDLLFNESIIPQGLIIPVYADDGTLSFHLTRANTAFNEMAKIESIHKPVPVREIFQFLEGFNCQPIQQFFKSVKTTNAQFVYACGDGSYKLSLKKIGHETILFALQDISELQDARSELNEKKRQLKESQEIAHLGYWIESHNSKKHFWSDQIFKILNETAESITPSFDNYLKFVFEEDRKNVEDAFHSAIQNKTGFDITHRLRLNNGTVKYVSQRCYTHYDYNNEPLQSVGIIQDITSSEIIKEELKHSEEIFRSVFEFAPIAIVLVNEKFMPVFCNHQFCDLIGYTMEQVYTRGLKELTYPDDYENNLLQYQRLFKGEVNSFSITKRYVHQDGSTLWAKVIVSALKNPGGLPNMAIAMVQDISAEKKATDALVKSEYKYRTLIENANDGIGLFDLNFKPVIYNTVLYKMLGYSLEEYLKFDHNKYELFHPDDIPSAKKALATLKKNKQARIENRMRHKDGSYSYFSISYIPVIHEDKPAILIFRRDISKRKNAELQNEEYRRFLETIMDNLPVSLFAKTTPDFRYLYWNRTLEKVTGISADDAIGKTDFELFQSRQMAEQYLGEDQKLIKYKKKLDSEHEFTNSIGESKQFKTIKTLHQTETGNPLILGISVDITKLKEAEQQIQQSTQMLKEAQKIAKLGYWEYDVKKDLFFDNLENRQILGTENLPYFINRQQFNDLLHPKDQKVVQQAFKRCINTKTPGKGIIRILSGTSPRHVAINYRPVEDAQGKVEKLRGTCLDITRIRESEMALRESEKRLKQAEHIAKVGYYDYDYKTNETKFSDEIWKILEVSGSRVNVSFADFLDKVHIHDKVQVLAQFHKSKNTNQPFDIEFKIITHHGNLKYIKAIGTFVKNQDGSLARSIGTFQDVTDLKKKEKDLEKTAKQLSAIQDIAQMGFVEYNQEGTHFKVSQTLVKVLELNQTDELKQVSDYYKFIHEEDRETISKTIEKSIAQLQSYNIQYRLRLPSGKLKFVSEICNINSESNTLITRIIQDITPLKKQKISIDKMSGGQESTLLGTWEYNLKTQKYLLDKGICNLFDLPMGRNELTDTEFMTFIHTEDREAIAKVKKEAIKQTESFTVSFRMVLKDQKIKYVQNFSNFYTNAAGDEIMYGMIRDITEFRNTYNELQDKKELFEKIAENSLMGVVIYQEEVRVYANKKWEQLLGFMDSGLGTNLKLEDIYTTETAQLIRDLFKNWQDYQLTEYANELTFHPLNAPEFTAEVFVREIQYKGKQAFLILALPKP